MKKKTWLAITTILLKYHKQIFQSPSTEYYSIDFINRLLKIFPSILNLEKNHLFVILNNAYYEIVNNLEKKPSVRIYPELWDKRIKKICLMDEDYDCEYYKLSV